MSFHRRRFFHAVGDTALTGLTAAAMGAAACARVAEAAEPVASAGGTARAHDGSDIVFEAHGDGPNVLFPGIPSRGGFVTALASQARLVFFQYPGRPKPTTLTPDAIVRDVLAVADTAGADRFAWFGYSWTAVVGLQLAIRTDRLTGLFIGGFPPLGGPYAEMLALATAKLERAQPANEPQLRQWVTLYQALWGFDDRAIQRWITCPRLCWVGSEDRAMLDGKLFADFAGVIRQNRAELEKLGWDVRILEGLDHLGAARDEVVIPLLRDWFKARLR
jgi:pimeloyl-ACP methyl ester carboxylesterase